VLRVQYLRKFTLDLVDVVPTCETGEEELKMRPSNAYGTTDDCKHDRSETLQACEGSQWLVDRNVQEKRKEASLALLWWVK